MRYLLYGHGSFKNKGCEALVTTITEQIKDYDKDAYIVLASFDKENDENNRTIKIDKIINHSIKEKLNDDQKNLEKEYIDKKDNVSLIRLYQKKVLDELKNIDYSFSIGGDNYSEGHVEYLHQINLECLKNKVKNVLLGCSIYEDIEDIKLIRDLYNFDLIVSRESLSTLELSKVIDNDRLIQNIDPAFSLGVKKCNLPYEEKSYVAINLSEYIINPENNVFTDIITLIKYIIEKYNKNIVLIPHVYVDQANDYLTLKRIKDEFSDDERVSLINECSDISAKEVKYIISKSYALIAARTHASVAAYSTCVPTLVIGYSLKSKGLAKDLFNNINDFVIPFNELNYDTLRNKFDNLIDNYDKIKLSLEDKMISYKKEASELIKNTMTKLDYLEYEVIPKHMCMACKTCSFSCPVDAIEMKKDEEGFIHPFVNRDKCIKCGKCKNICPVNSDDYNFNSEAYACKNKDIEIVNNSSSGGIFYLLAKNILEKNGIVYGVAIVDNYAKHIRVTELNDLYKIMGSKYMESDKGNIYNEVKEDLKNNKLVLFSGTPCEIAGLKNFIGKNNENLYTASVICHGTPSRKIWEHYLDYLGFSDESNTINFRDKRNGWEDYDITIQNDKSYITDNAYKNLYMHGFINNYYLKKSCYNCKFKFKSGNNSDIILGDYWNIQKIHPEFYYKNGVSAIILNSKKGLQLFDEIKNNLEYIPTNVDDIYKFNSSLCDSAELNINRIKMRDRLNYSFKDFMEICKVSELNKEIDDIIKDKEDIIRQKDIEISSIIEELENIKKSKRYQYSTLLANAKKRIMFWQK